MVLSTSMNNQKLTKIDKKKKKTVNGLVEDVTHLNLRNNINDNNSDTECGSLIIGEIQCEELFAEQLEVSRNLTERFSLIEMSCGLENTKLVAQFLCSCAPFGITRLELLDAFRLRKRISNVCSNAEGEMCAKALVVLKHFGI